MNKIALVGDVMLGRTVSEVLKREGTEFPWGDTLPLIKRAGVRICNLECVISDKGEPWSLTEKPFHFRTDPKNVAVLQMAGMTAVSLANNHVLDFGPEAMRQMLLILDEAGIEYSGCGESIKEAEQLATWQINGEKMGLIAFTDNEPAWEATKDRWGTNFLPVETGGRKVEEFLAKVRKARREVDLLVVSGHWGGNWGYRPPEEHRRLGRALVEAGADIVFGHSSHVCRGVETYQGKVIIYGAGDFIDDYAVDEIERNDRSMIFGVEESKGKIESVYFYPTVIEGFQARMAKGEVRQEIARKMSELCRELGTETAWSETRGRLEARV